MAELVKPWRSQLLYGCEQLGLVTGHSCRYTGSIGSHHFLHSSDSEMFCGKETQLHISKRRYTHGHIDISASWQRLRVGNGRSSGSASSRNWCVVTWSVWSSDYSQSETEKNKSIHRRQQPTTTASTGRFMSTSYSILHQQQQQQL